MTGACVRDGQSSACGRDTVEPSNNGHVGGGSLVQTSTVERLSLSQRFANKPHPEVTNRVFNIEGCVACNVFMHTCSERTQDNQIE